MIIIKNFRKKTKIKKSRYWQKKLLKREGIPEGYNTKEEKSIQIKAREAFL
jgi:hypothetical protein